MPWTESVSDPGRQVTSCSDRETYDERLTTSCVPSQHTLTLFAPIPNAVIVGQLRAIEAKSFVLGGNMRVFLSPGVPVPDYPLGTSLTVVAVSRQGGATHDPPTWLDERGRPLLLSLSSSPGGLSTVSLFEHFRILVC